MLDTLRHYRKIQARSRREIESELRQALRRDCPRDRYAIWCAERAGVKLSRTQQWWSGEWTPDFKIAYDQRIGSLDGIAIFYTGNGPGWRERTEYVKRGRSTRCRRTREWSDDYEGEIARVIIPNAYWEPGPVLDLSDTSCVSLAA